MNDYIFNVSRMYTDLKPQYEMHIINDCVGSAEPILEIIDRYTGVATRLTVQMIIGMTKKEGLI